jgi:hypothetical protein
MKTRISNPLSSTLAPALAAAILSWGTSACSSDSSESGADAGAAGADAATEPDAAAPGALIVSVGGDYAGTGILSTLKLPEMEVTVNAVAGVVGGDPALRAFGDQLFILDRFGGDSVTVLNRELGLVGQVSTGVGSNPQDVAVIGDTLYVAAWDASGVLVIDLQDISGGVVDTIDLAALDDVDGVPDCNSIYAVGTRLFVSCQIMDRNTFSPRGAGKVAVIDADSASLETTLDLSSSNPLAHFEALPGGDLVFSTAPGALFGASNDSGCLERISTSGTPSLMGCLSRNVDLDAYPSDVLPVGNSVYFVNVASFTEADIRVHKGASVSQPSMTVGPNVAALTACPTGHLVVSDNSDGARGLRVFDDAGEALHGDPVDMGWPASFAPGNATICW